MSEMITVPGDLRSAKELAGGLAEGPDRRRARGGHRHDRPAAAPPPRRRPGRQEQAHQGNTQRHGTLFVAVRLAPIVEHLN